MHYTENYQLPSTILEKLLSKIGREEREDKHPSVSDLNYCLTRTYWDTTDKAIRPSDKTVTYWVLGLGLEKVLIGDLESEPKEGIRDGIWYHMDGLTGVTILELKTTRASASKWNPESMSETWSRQIKAYTHAAGASHIEYLVLHIIQAELKAWDVEYTPEELSKNWEWFLSRKAIWDNAVAKGVPPASYMHNMKWECRDCVYSTRCEALAYIKKAV